MDYQGNSDKKKEKAELAQTKNIQPVVTSEVIQRPKSFGRKFKDVFFDGDFKSTASFVIAEVVLPAFRNMIVDSGHRGLEKLVHGDSRFRGNNSMGYRPTVQYNNPGWRSGSMRDPRDRPVFLPDQVPHYRRQNVKEANNLIVKTRDEAERIVEMMIDVLNQYPSVSLADLMTMINEKSTPIDNKWGWTYLNNISIRSVREGYLIELPPLEEI